MIKLPAPQMLRNWLIKDCTLYLPGGWIMNVPEFRIDDDFEELYIQGYRKLGFSFEKARSRVDRAVQSLAVYGFRSSLFNFTFHYMKQYCTMYPERMQPAPLRRKRCFVAAGFKPELIQLAHIPKRHPGKADAVVKRMLLEMKV